MPRNSAVVVVDMQGAFADIAHDAAGTLCRAADVIARARTAAPVV
ncbi:hypothetical protein [Tsukamurella soli]